MYNSTPKKSASGTVDENSVLVTANNPKMLKNVPYSHKITSLVIIHHFYKKIKQGFVKI
jgi:hypothetical protein